MKKNGLLCLRQRNDVGCDLKLFLRFTIRRLFMVFLLRSLERSLTLMCQFVTVELSTETRTKTIRWSLKFRVDFFISKKRYLIIILVRCVYR